LSEEQADNAKAHDLYEYWKPLSWLGTIHPTSVYDEFNQESSGKPSSPQHLV